MKVGDLFVALGIKTDESKLKAINTGFSNLRRGLIETKVAFLGAVWGLDKFISSSVQGVASIDNIAQQTGLSFQELQKFDMAGQMSNLAIGAGQTANAIGNLQKQIALIRMGQGNIAPFQMLGIDVVGKNAFEVIKDLRKNIQGLSPDIATNLISQLGLDPAMISLLKLSNKEFDKLTNQGGLGKGGRSSILQTGFALKQLELKIQRLKDQIVVAISPVIQKFINQFLNWIIKNQSKIRNALTDFIEKIAYFIAIIAEGVGVLIKFAENIFGAEKGMKLFGLAVAGLLLSLSPFVAKLAIISGIMHDFQNWKLGKDNMFGDLYKTIAGIADKLGLLKKTITGAFDFDEKTQKNIDSFSKAMSGLKGSLMLGLVGAVIGGKIGGLQGAAIGGGIGLGAGLINEFIDWQKELLNDEKLNKKNFNPEKSLNKNQTNNITINTQVNTDSNIAPSVLEKHQKKGVLDALQLNNSGF